MITYLFVDGGALHGRLQNLSDRSFDKQIFNVDFGRLKQSYSKVFYYDALPVREERESEADYETRIKPKKDVLDRAASTDGVHVYEGDARRRRKRGLQQKKVDVMLTVDMLTHSFRNNMQRATLLTGDNDFKPLIDALVQDGMFVDLWYPPEETSRELMQAADGRVPLTMLRLYELLTDESRSRFTIPSRENVRPGSIQMDNPLVAWNHSDGNVCALYHHNGYYVYSKEGDRLNTFHVSHQDENLLRYFCQESLNIEIPPQG